MSFQELLTAVALGCILGIVAGVASHFASKAFNAWRKHSADIMRKLTDRRLSLVWNQQQQWWFVIQSSDPVTYPKVVPLAGSMVWMEAVVKGIQAYDAQQGHKPEAWFGKFQLVSRGLTPPAGMRLFTNLYETHFFWIIEAEIDKAVAAGLHELIPSVPQQPKGGPLG
jgi:hypothetical protein